MKTLVVKYAILSPTMDAKACVVGAPKMLKNAGIKNVKDSCWATQKIH
jgi:hypothetical protein